MPSQPPPTLLPPPRPELHHHHMMSRDGHLYLSFYWSICRCSFSLPSTQVITVNLKGNQWHEYTNPAFLIPFYQISTSQACFQIYSSYGFVVMETHLCYPTSLPAGTQGKIECYYCLEMMMMTRIDCIITQPHPFPSVVYFVCNLQEGKLKNFTYHDHPMLALIGFLAVSVLLACMFFADHYSGPSIVAIIEPAIPVSLR